MVDKIDFVKDFVQQELKKAGYNPVTEIIAETNCDNDAARLKAKEILLKYSCAPFAPIKSEESEQETRLLQPISYTIETQSE